MADMNKWVRLTKFLDKINVILKVGGNESSVRTRCQRK